MQTCPECQHKSLNTAQFCTNCGRQFSEIESPKETSCPSCGNTILPGQKFCVTCGSTLDPSTPIKVPNTPQQLSPVIPAKQPEKPASQPSKKSRKNSIVWLIILCVALFVTNPKQHKHERAVAEHMVDYLKTYLAEGANSVADQNSGSFFGLDFGFLGGTIESFLDKMALNFIEDNLSDFNILEYHNYLLFSTTSFSTNGQYITGKTISLGVMGTTFVITPVDQWFTFDDSMQAVYEFLSLWVPEEILEFLINAISSSGTIMSLENFQEAAIPTHSNPSDSSSNSPTLPQPQPQSQPTPTRRTPSSTPTRRSSPSPSPDFSSHEILKEENPLTSTYSNITIDFYEKFDSFDPALWKYYPTSTQPNLSGGKLSMTGSNGWETGLGYLSKDIKTGEGILLVYSHSGNVEFEVKLENGNWNSSEYKRWGVYLMYPAWSDGYKTNVFRGTSQIGYEDLTGNIQIKPGDLYCIFIGIDEQRNFITLIWKKDQPNKYLYIGYQNLHEAMNLWEFGISGNKGVLDIESVTRISFQK